VSPCGLPLRLCSRGLQRDAKFGRDIGAGEDCANGRCTAKASNVIEVLADIVQPADRRKRFEIEDVHRAYVAACEARGAVGCRR
jgi:hypothetical protein